MSYKSNRKITGAKNRVNDAVLWSLYNDKPLPDKCIYGKQTADNDDAYCDNDILVDRFIRVDYNLNT